MSSRTMPTGVLLPLHRRDEHERLCLSLRTQAPRPADPHAHRLRGEVRPPHVVTDDWFAAVRDVLNGNLEDLGILPDPQRMGRPIDSIRSYLQAGDP